jgi:hypothetical protein
MKVTRQKIELAVKHILVKGMWPVYNNQKDSGLTEEEYANFVTEALNEISAMSKLELA